MCLFLSLPGVDQDVSPPQVTVFAPPKQEVDEKEKATIVCLVTNFFPDHVALSWTVNNEKRTAGVKTEDPVYDKTTKRYSMTSRLRITKEEWQNADNKFVCRVSFHGTEGSTDYEDDINGADCGGGSEAARGKPTLPCAFNAGISLEIKTQETSLILSQTTDSPSSVCQHWLAATVQDFYKGLSQPYLELPRFEPWELCIRCPTSELELFCQPVFYLTALAINMVGIKSH
uniref:Ig-like domain-containing protein n=1 Tax=Podarcis muralis TaxID=64176 RepID=A0A670K1Z9_PODMU